MVTLASVTLNRVNSGTEEGIMCTWKLDSDL